mgnify:CR=1 FL=1
MFDLSTGRTRLPKNLSRDALLLGTPVHLPVRFSAALARRGVRRLFVCYGGSIVVIPISRAMARAGLRVAGIKAFDALDRLDSRVEATRRPLALALRPVLAAARRCLQRLRPANRFRALSSVQLAQLASRVPTQELNSESVVMFNSALAWGGAERQLVNTLRGLNRNGWSVQLFCEHLGAVRDSYFFAPELAQSGVSYAALEAAAAAAEPALDPALANRLKAGLAELPPPFAGSLWPYLAVLLAARPHVVHAWQDQTAILAGTAAVIAGVPRIVLATRNMSPCNFGYHQPHMRESYQLLATQPGVCLLNNSAAGARDYADWLGLPVKCFTVVPNGFEAPADGATESGAQLRARLGIPADAPLVGSIFRFYPEKDPLLWLETAAKVAERVPRARFLLVGTGPLEAELHRVARRGVLADKVFMLGTIPDPRPVLSALDIFLLTSRFEGLPNVLIEAQMAGVPVVSTLAGGTAETFIDGITGRLVHSRDATDLARAICAILDDVTWAANARFRAQEQAQARFGLNRMLDDTIALYRC